MALGSMTSPFSLLLVLATANEVVPGGLLCVVGKVEALGLSYAPLAEVLDAWLALGTAGEGQNVPPTLFQIQSPWELDGGLGLGRGGGPVGQILTEGSARGLGRNVYQKDLGISWLKPS